MMFRVSRVLAAAGLVDTTWFTEQSRDRGRAVHAIAEAIFQQQVVYSAPAYEGFASAIRAGVVALGFEAVCVEQRLSAFDLSGRPDAIGFVRRPLGSFI